MERREWKIYKRTNLVNGKVYIGQTKQRNWLDRIYQENRPSNKQVITYAVLKYGIDNFKNEIIEDKLYSQDDADRAEIKWIKHYDSCNPDKGYNRTHGGQGTGKECIAGTGESPVFIFKKEFFLIVYQNLQVIQEFHIHTVFKQSIELMTHIMLMENILCISKNLKNLIVLKMQ